MPGEIWWLLTSLRGEEPWLTVDVRNPASLLAHDQPGPEEQDFLQRTADGVQMGQSVQGLKYPDSSWNALRFWNVESRNRVKGDYSSQTVRQYLQLRAAILQCLQSLHVKSALNFIRNVRLQCRFFRQATSTRT